MTAPPEASSGETGRVPDDQQITAAGKIHMLDLAALKARLGNKWERMSAPVRLFFEAAIKRGLGPGDTFCHVDELSYLVMFRDLTAVQAELKCAAIAEEVCKRLFGENGEQVALRNLVGQIDMRALPRDIDRNDALNALLERHGKESIVSADPGRSARHAVEEIGGRIFRLTFGGDAGQHRVASRDIMFVYRPIWDTAKQAVLMYLCQPTLAVIQNAPVRPVYGFCLAEGEEDQSALDVLVLQECINRATRLNGAGLRVLLAVPVHFNTIARPRFWMAYAAAYRQTPPDVLRDLAFAVFGIDTGVPNIRLAQELPKLSRGIHPIICMIDHRDGAGIQFARTGAFALGMALDHCEPEKLVFEKLDALAKAAKEASAETFALGVSSTSIVLNAINSGVRFLEGTIVRPVVSDPRHAYVHGVEDLYQLSLAQMPRRTAGEP
jgi:hypothetical protein